MKTLNYSKHTWGCNQEPLPSCWLLWKRTWRYILPSEKQYLYNIYIYIYIYLPVQSYELNWSKFLSNTSTILQADGVSVVPLAVFRTRVANTVANTVGDTCWQQCCEHLLAAVCPLLKWIFFGNLYKLFKVFILKVFIFIVKLKRFYWIILIKWLTKLSYCLPPYIKIFFRKN